MSAPAIDPTRLAAAVERVRLVAAPAELTGQDAPRVAAQLELPLELVAAAIAQLTGREPVDVEPELPSPNGNGASAQGDPVEVELVAQRLLLDWHPEDLSGHRVAEASQRLGVTRELVIAAIAQLTGRPRGELEGEANSPDDHDGQDHDDALAGSPAAASEPATGTESDGFSGRELAARRRGVVPSDLRARIELATSDFVLRGMAGMLGHELQGLSPQALTADELARLRETYGEAPDVEGPIDAALEVLVAVGYGKRPGRKPRRRRNHGVRREQRLSGVTGKTPRAFALRAPFTADTHRSGRMDGVDVWGPMRCSHTLRSLHHGLVAAAGGLWHKRSKDGQPFFDCTATELAALHNGRLRQGGKEIAEVMGALADLAALEIRATVDHRGEGPPSDAHVIPGSPFAAVERRLPGTNTWVPLAEYAAALDTEDVAAAYSAIEADEDSSAGTLRVHLAPWFIDEITGRKGRGPVLVNFDVWGHLRPTDRRVYAFVQGKGRSFRDRTKVEFYLAEELRFTLGLQGERHEAAAAVRHALTALYHADQRYVKGFAEYTHPNGHPAFTLRPDGPSVPTHKARVTKVPPRRPGVLRGLQSRLRRSALLAGRAVRVDELDPGHRREVGDEQALREAQEVRRQVLESLGSSYAGRRLDESDEQRERAARAASARARAARDGPAP